jgi:hypothetical protein
MIQQQLTAKNQPRYKIEFPLGYVYSRRNMQQFVIYNTQLCDMQHCYKHATAALGTVRIYNIMQRPCTMHPGLLPARDQVIYDLSIYVGRLQSFCVVSSIHRSTPLQVIYLHLALHLEAAPLGKGQAK